METTSINTGADAGAELWQLASRSCNDALRPEDLARLESLLAEDRQAQHFYGFYMLMHAELAWRFRAGGQTSIEGFGSVDSPVIDASVGEAVGLPFRHDPESPAPPFPSLSTAHYPLPTPFVGGPVFSYMVATLILGVMLLSAWAYKTTHFQPQFVEAPAKSVPSGVRPELVFVGRISGMKDCRWSDPRTEAYAGASVPLNRRYALSSGLMEITYKTGAKVILEGPCTYEVDSSAGGYLSLGKLTARVNTRDEGDSHSPLFPLPSPLFSVRTPTAVVTDLGTEFGVEVSANGNTTSHVFRGSVKVQVVGTSFPSLSGRGAGGESCVVLRANESARVEKDKGSDPRLVLGDAVGEIPEFARHLAARSKSPDREYALDGGIFQDDFDGKTVDSNKWAIFALEDGTVSVADGLATIRSKLFPPKGVASLCCAHALDFSSSPEDWWAEIRFKMDGELSSSFRIMRDWIVFAGVSMTSGKRVIQGFDLRAMQRGTTDSATFDLGWHGWDYAYRERIPVALARNLNKGQFYTVKIHRKPDSTVDIYLDDRLIAGKPLIASRNPVLLRCGDISMFIGGTQVIDYVNMGSLIRHASVSNNEKRKEGRPMKQ